MFASFWNRNHALRALQRAVNNFHAMVEAEKKVCSCLLVLCDIFFLYCLAAFALFFWNCLSIKEKMVFVKA